MCMIDGADGCNTFSSEHKHVARKAHKCSECGRPIAAGETYWRLSALFEGDFTETKMCAHCRVGADWLVENCGGFMTHGVHEDLREHVEEYGYTKAKAIPGVARIVVGMKRDWITKRGPRAGQLMPLPRLPAKLEPTLHR